MLNVRMVLCCAAMCAVIFAGITPSFAAPSTTQRSYSGVIDYKNFMHAYAEQLVQSGAAENPYVRDWIKKKGAGDVLNNLLPPPPMVSMLPPRLLPRQMDRSGAGDYLNEMVAHGAKRWSANRFPLHVFIASGGGDGYKSSFPAIAASALNEWCDGADHHISWVPTSDPNCADIVVQWAPYTGHGSVEAGDTRTLSDLSGNINHVSVNLATIEGGQPISDAEMKKTCLHELGHAFGLCHSSSSGDIMFWQSNPSQGCSLCARDMNTMSRLYSIR